MAVISKKVQQGFSFRHHSNLRKILLHNLRQQLHLIIHIYPGVLNPNSFNNISIAIKLTIVIITR